MRNRLLHFLSAENITQSQLADTLGVAKASVSHILAGRNKPSCEFIENLAKHYPAINLEWLFTGKGKMYKEAFNDNIFDAANDMLSSPVSSENTNAPVDKSDLSPRLSIDTISPKTGRRISRIIVFYDDSSYLELH